MPRSTPYYPAFLDLTERECVVVGGGRVALRKVTKLLTADARVTIISPKLTEELRGLVDTAQLNWVSRTYQSGDIDAAWLVFAATDDRQVNHTVALEAKALGKLVNVVDDPDECSMIIPASTQQGRIQVAVSTGGTDPSLARRLRRLLEEDLRNQSDGFIQELRKHM